MSSQTLDFSNLVAPKEAFRLYNPSSEEVVQDFGAKTWRLPPKGVLPIHDIRVRGRDKEPPQILPARDIVVALCGEDGRSGKLGAMGVRPLFGDSRDELVKAEADAAYVESRYATALGEKLAHLSRVEKEKAAGIAVTPPSKKVRDAMEYVARVERERGLTGALTCSDCGWPLLNEQDKVAHIANIHPEKAPKGQGFGAEVAPEALFTGAPTPPATVNVQQKIDQVVAARPRPQPRGGR